ncbi:hypothetical protein AKJ37_03790, partial [candidate division MSBL1 archaeon SCGC-AAA259I09]
GFELGGENKRFRVGDWEEFHIMVRNDSNSSTNPWEDILIRAKFHGIEPENLQTEYEYNGAWNSAYEYDLRLLNSETIGSAVDLGPEEGYVIDPQTEKDLGFRVKADRPVENLRVEFQAITSNYSSENYVRKIKNPENTKLLNPVQDTYIDQQNPTTNYSEKKHLELTTQENNNSYALLKFENSNIPTSVDTAQLYLYQYWGSAFSDLKNSEVTVRIYTVPEDLNLESTTWKTGFEVSDEIVAEKEILGIREWYRFDLTDYFKSSTKDEATLLVKFSKDSFDNEERRIRFDSSEADRPPYLVFG